MSLVQALEAVSTVEAYREAQAQARVRGGGAALEPRSPVPPTPPVPATIATTDLEAAAWAATVAALMTSVSGVAAIKLIAEANPAYAKIIQKATETTTTSAETAATIVSDGAEILAAYSGG